MCYNCENTSRRAKIAKHKEIRNFFAQVSKRFEKSQPMRKVCSNSHGKNIKLYGPKLSPPPHEPFHMIILTLSSPPTKTVDQILWALVAVLVDFEVEGLVSRGWAEVEKQV